MASQQVTVTSLYFVAHKGPQTHENTWLKWILIKSVTALRTVEPSVDTQLGTDDMFGIWMTRIVSPIDELHQPVTTTTASTYIFCPPFDSVIAFCPELIIEEAVEKVNLRKRTDQIQTYCGSQTLPGAVSLSGPLMRSHSALWDECTKINQLYRLVSSVEVSLDTEINQHVDLFEEKISGTCWR